MGKLATKVPNFCLNVIRRLARARRPTIQSRNNQEKKQGGKDNSGGGEKSGPLIAGRKVMIVANAAAEDKNAVQWALTHTVQSQDTVILLHIVKPSKLGDQSITEDSEVKVPEFLTCLKNSCQIKKPEVGIEVMVVEGKEKGPAVVAAAEREGAALLVVGQKKRWLTWTWAGGDGVAEYCVENASSGCMAVAVRRQSKKLGGYVITTKRHKDFWLLA